MYPDYDDSYLHITADTKQLEFDDETYFHVESVEVYTGNDDCEETDAILVKPVAFHSDKLTATRKVYLDGKPPTRTRVRFEPAVRIRLTGEDHFEYTVNIAHHKGNIHFWMERGKQSIPPND